VWAVEQKDSEKGELWEKIEIDSQISRFPETLSSKQSGLLCETHNTFCRVISERSVELVLTRFQESENQKLRLSFFLSFHITLSGSSLTSTFSFCFILSHTA